MHYQRWSLPLVAAILSVNAYPCQRVTPVSSVDMVNQADVILRVSAVDYAVAPGNPDVLMTGVPDSTIRFKVLEVIRGGTQPELILHGYLTHTDDFNDLAPPYGSVRPGGRLGSCFANSYRLGGEFLLLLKKGQSGELTVNWYALGPVNEQLHSANDPWLLWVRGQVEKQDSRDGK
jgi:hypothetical protein